MCGGSCEKWQLASHDHMIVWWAARTKSDICSFVQVTRKTFFHAQMIPAALHQVRLANLVLLPLRLLCKFLRKRVLQRARITTYIVSVDPLLDIAGSVHHVVHYQASVGGLEIITPGTTAIEGEARIVTPFFKNVTYAIETRIRSVEVFEACAEKVYTAEFMDFSVDIDPGAYVHIGLP